MAHSYCFGSNWKYTHNCLFSGCRMFYFRILCKCSRCFSSILICIHIFYSHCCSIALKGMLRIGLFLCSMLCFLCIRIFPHCSCTLGSTDIILCICLLWCSKNIHFNTHRLIHYPSSRFSHSTHTSTQADTLCQHQSPYKHTSPLNFLQNYLYKHKFLPLKLC